MAESWKSVARALAIRLEHQPEPCCTPVDPGCGYCSDALAYQRYVKRLAVDGKAPGDPFADMRGTVIAPEDVQRTEGQG